MTGLVDWAASRARMVIAFIVLSILAGSMALTILFSPSHLPPLRHSF